MIDVKKIKKAVNKASEALDPAGKLPKSKSVSEELKELGEDIKKL